MPLKKDGTGRRWVEMELVVPGTPEQVWQAMATGPGTTAWFTRATIDERVGGTVRFDFGPNGSSTGEVTTWEPPLRFGYVERDWSEGAPPVATEITVTGRSGGRCVVRMVHSLFASTDDWDDQLESFENGWPAFFEVLRLYLAHFAGERRTASFFVMAPMDVPLGVGWKRLTDALGLAAANVGDEKTVPASSQDLTGIVERIQQDTKQRYLMLRLNAPTSGVALIGAYGTDKATNASMAVYLYGDDAARQAAAAEPKWRDWLGAAVKPA